jgi:hypothetical protein
MKETSLPLQMSKQHPTFPNFFFETFQGDIFTNNSLEKCYCVAFVLVSLFSKKDQHRIWLYKDLYEDICHNEPSLTNRLKFVALSADTPSSMKKLKGEVFDFFPILSIPDKKLFEQIHALRTFSFFNIKASEPARKTFLLDPNRAILWTWESEELPSMDNLLHLLSANQ